MPHILDHSRMLAIMNAKGEKSFNAAYVVLKITGKVFCYARVTVKTIKSSPMSGHRLLRPNLLTIARAKLAPTYNCGLGIFLFAIAAEVRPKNEENE